MIGYKRSKKRIFLRIITIIIIQIFLVTNLGLSKPLYNRNISSSYIDTKGLRVPVGFGKVGSDTALSDRIQSAQAQARDTIGAESILSSLKEIQEQIAEYARAGAITEEEQKAQNAYITQALELLSKHINIFNSRPYQEIGYLNYVIKEWVESLSQYSNKPSMIYGQTRAEAYISYAELVLVELKASIAIAEGRYTKSLQEVEYKKKTCYVTVYKLDGLSWNVVEYMGDGTNGIMTRVYFYPDGYQDNMIFERALRAALVTGVAISDVHYAIENFGVISKRYSRHFITSDPFKYLPGDLSLWAKRFNEHKTVMAISQLGVVISCQRIFKEYARTTERWIAHMKHEVGHKVEAFYNVEDKIPRWFNEGTKNAQFWASSYDLHFILQLIRGESVVRLNEMTSFSGGPDFSHSTLFCDYIDEVTDGKLAEGWVEIERRISQENKKFEQAFEEVIGQPLLELMDQFYSRLIPLAIQSVDRIVELEYEREAIHKTTGIDVSLISVDKLKNVLREALQNITTIKFSGNEKQSASNEERRQRIEPVFIGLRNSALHAGFPAMALGLTACIEHLDELLTMLDISNERIRLVGDGAMRTLPLSLMAAFQYASLKDALGTESTILEGEWHDSLIEKLLNKFSDINNSEDWWSEIQRLLRSENTKRIILKNMWRPVSTPLPRRAISLQAILSAFFQDKPVFGLDLGSGLHIALPLVQSGEFSREKIDGLQLTPVNIAYGAGVDIQEEDLLWALVSLWPGENNNKHRELAWNAHQYRVRKGDNRFPRYTADILQSETYLEKIQRDVKRLQGELGYKQSGKLTFIFTSFVTYQLPRSRIEDLQQIITDLLEEGGIWVDIGHERLMPDTQDIREFGVRVYRKSGKTLEFLGIPVYLDANEVNIKRVNEDWFREMKEVLQEKTMVDSRKNLRGAAESI